MTTSGTVAQTTLDTAVVLEHAVRRCGIQASLQTPEMVQIGQQNLYLLLLNLANRGLNLWCVERDFIGLTEDKATYVLPDGTLRVLNVLYSMPTEAAGTLTATTTSVSSDLGADTKIVRYGFKPASTVTTSFTLSSSDDGVEWTTRQTLATDAWVAGEWYWFNLDPSVTAQYFKISSVDTFDLTTFYLASLIRDVPMTQFNRDEYAQQVNKTYQQRPCTNFYFEKLVNPQLTVWPVPNNSTDHLSVWRHRFVQDVGALTEQIEVPQQWVECIVWQLAARLAYELPNVDPQRRQEVLQASERFLMDAELGETDNAPIYFLANVSCYTR